MQDIVLHSLVYHKGLNNLQIPGMFVVADSDSLVRSVLFHEISQLSHLFIHILYKVEVVQLCQAQLTVIVIEAFFRDGHLPSCLLQIHAFWGRCKLFGWLAQLSPSFYQSYSLTYRSLFTSDLPLPSAVLLYSLVSTFWICLLRFFLEPNEDDAWFQKVARDETALSIYFVQFDKLVGLGVIDADSELGWRAVNEEQVGDIHDWLLVGDLPFDEGSLLGILFLKHECFWYALWVL